MAAGHDIAEFLTSRRAKITPEQAGFPPSATPGREQPANSARFTFLDPAAVDFDLLASWTTRP